MNRKSLKVIILTTKLLVSVYTCWYVYYKLFVECGIDVRYRQYQDTMGSVVWPFVLFTMLLMFVNWGLEAAKWQYLIQRKETLSWFTAFKAVLSGTSISLITPNRIGEYAGRVVYLEQYDKVKAALTTMIGSFAQLSVTVAVGCVCFCLELKHILPSTELGWQTIILLCLLLVVLVLLLYYNIWIIAPLSRRLPYIKKYAPYFDEFEQYTYSELTYVLLLSTLRYAVFTLQYLLLLYAFRVDIDISDAIKVIPVLFLVQSIVPSSTLTELGIRGSSALYFFAWHTHGEVNLVLSAYGLWIINLIIPAIIGLVLLFRVRFLKSSS